MKFQKVLLVDDDEIVNSINKIIIQHYSFAEEIVVETFASKAIEYLQDATNKGSLPDIIFLDLNMPLMNGWEFIDAYRKLNLDREAKIVMLTSSVDPQDQERALNTDLIFEFTRKPLSPTILDDLIEKFQN